MVNIDDLRDWVVYTKESQSFTFSWADALELHGPDESP